MSVELANFFCLDHFTVECLWSHYEAPTQMIDGWIIVWPQTCHSTVKPRGKVLLVHLLSMWVALVKKNP